MKNNFIYKAYQRGSYRNNWLDSKFSFSFADYYNPEFMAQGNLRVLNDDKIAPSSGFGMHSHRNMEIITVVLKGSLLHQDSMGFKEHIVPGEVQMMSAGTGVNHSEWNDSKDTEVELLQLWVMPNVFDKTPSYSSLKYSEEDLENKLFLIAGPELENKNLQIKQDTKLYLAKIKKGQSITLTSSYEKNEDFLFVIEGNIRIGNENIEKRDAYFKFDSTPEKIQATEDSFILFANSKA